MNVLSAAILAIAIVLLLAFIFHNQIIRVIYRFTHVLFFLGFLGLLSVAFLPYLYINLVDGLFETSYLGRQLQELDSSLIEIDEATSKWQQQWNRLFSQEEQEETSADPVQLYPSFLTLLSVSLMIIIGVFSFLIMILSIYFKYTFIGYMSAVAKQ